MNWNQVNYLYELAYGFWKSQIIFTAVESGVFTLIADNGKTAGGIALQLKTNKRATEMLLNALVALGLLRKAKDKFFNTPLSNQYLVRGAPFYIGDSIHHMHNLWDNWSKLGRAVKTGKPVAFKNAKKKVNAGRTRDFIAAMQNIGRTKAAEIAKRFDLKGCRKLLDLGGGPGTYSIEFTKRNHRLKAIVFDLEDVIRLAKRYIKDAGMQERVSTIAGDCLKDDLGTNLYDVAFVSNILHIYDPETNIEILKKCWESLVDNGKVVIHEFVLDRTKTRPQFGALFSLQMLLGTMGGASYSEQEYRDWLPKAGFKAIKRINLPSDSSLLIGVKKPVS
ncbi:MAG TPA: class I SAM-dependent methyltransferase [Candidatus Brocadiia bacterium]|nr:class I SAM-dependent methyltransferase [Candidatus Brocadiales bacterium]